MTVTEVKYASEVIFTIDIPYLALTGELWGAFCEDLGENWPRYKGTAHTLLEISQVLGYFEWHHLILFVTLQQITDNQGNFEVNMSNSLFSIMPADGIELLGHRASAGTVVTDFRSSISGSGHGTAAVLLPGFAINW